MDLTILFFYILLLIISFLYSSVGHGGASGYIALMALFAFAPNEIRINALLLNILVAGVSFWQYFRVEEMKKNIVIPLFIASIPMAYIGGSISLNPTPFKILLAIVLLIPIIRFLGIIPEKNHETQNPKSYLLLLIGGGIGLISGLIGIGGGIILSPILILSGWTTVKQAAVISALFIVVNSASGLLGLTSKGIYIPDQFFPMAMVALVGGILGAYFGSRRFNAKILKQILAIVLIIAVVKLINV